MTNLQVETAETVRSVKEKIENNRHIRRELQILQCDGVVMEDRYCLYRYPINEYIWLVLDISMLSITLKTLTNERVELILDGEMLVGDLKSRIQVAMNFPREQQVLIYEDYVLADHRDFNFYRVLSGSVIYLIIRLRTRRED
ncbi:hypothetical protein ABFS82_10G092800 [Erythranthe guttata]